MQTYIIEYMGYIIERFQAEGAKEAKEYMANVFGDDHGYKLYVDVV